ncbi:U3-containing 90S pre-ribosomal complex subunit-domain containing protein [Cantharellus anzutake]|uniref:U3-containing 90S pre-ribosomal complex subunit-domain containing protein n=1 Tax=Cantharellus anzutake TaxID=1750568 RepID=UPI0019039238|nr:U3-containing 90S pre-ribosomal complex subunit-domain containing protein [Cantharellus anzutake]KAF8333974.1 U3-containing 90S pre-ribosomal complex subunit-domain containing protein [Cantharellus anzutake]
MAGDNLVSGDESELVEHEAKAKVSAKAEKSRKRRAKQSEQKAKAGLVFRQRLTIPDPEELRSAALTASQSPSFLANLLVTGQIQVFKGISELELDDKRIPESCIIDTRSWKGERNHEILPEFIRQGWWALKYHKTTLCTWPGILEYPKWLSNDQTRVHAFPSTLSLNVTDQNRLRPSAVDRTLATRIGQSSKDNGAPTCIILAGNALRVLDLIKPIKTMTTEKSGEISKLFARHFRLSQHAAHLEKTKVCVAVGTPNRVHALLTQTESLSLTALTHVILDVTFMDAKMRSMLDQLETKADVFHVLTHEPLRQRLVDGKTSLIFF